MELLLKRTWFYPDGIVGKLFLDGAFQCFTLEDPERGVGGLCLSKDKIPHVTCIPIGKYLVRKFFSPKRKKDVPVLLNVPNFTGIEIHVGNFPTDTDGCILVGDVRDPKKAAIYSSKPAFELLMERLQVGFLSNYLTITIVDEPEQKEAA